MNMKKLNENDSLEELLKKYGVFTQITTMEEFNEYIKNAKENKIYNNSILNHIPANSELLRNKRVILESLEIFGLDLEYVTGVLREDPQVIETAINSNPLALQYVEKPTEEQIKMAISKSGFALCFVNDKFKNDSNNRNFLLEIVCKSGSSMKYLPMYQNDDEFVSKATENNPYAIEYSGENISDQKVLFSIAEIQKEKDKTFFDYRKKCNDPVSFYAYYHNNNIALLELIQHIKSNCEKRFDNLDFMIKLSRINPIFSELASENVKKDNKFSEEFGNYSSPGLYTVFDMYQEKEEMKELIDLPEKEDESLPTDTKQGNIKPADIVQADITRKISKQRIQSIKGFFQKLIDKIIGNGER